jgi:hypothetical protein
MDVMQSVVFRGWQGDRKASSRVERHYAEALANFARSAPGIEPDICICNVDDAAVLRERVPEIHAVKIEGRTYMPHLRFYVGRMERRDPQ